MHISGDTINSRNNSSMSIMGLGFIYLDCVAVKRVIHYIIMNLVYY